ELVVLFVAPLAQARDRIDAQGPVHFQASSQDGPPFLGEIFSIDCPESGAPDQHSIALERLERRRRHPFPEPLSLPVAEARPGHPSRTRLVASTPARRARASTAARPP